MIRFHVEIGYTDGSVLVFSIENIEGLFDEARFLFGNKHGSIRYIDAKRDYYDSPVGISNQ